MLQKNRVQQTPSRYVLNNCVTSVTRKYNSAEDRNISYETYTASRPQSWERFINTLFPHQTKSVNIHRKCDTIFQIIHYAKHNGKKNNLFHVALAKLFHDDS